MSNACIGKKDSVAIVSIIQPPSSGRVWAQSSHGALLPTPASNWPKIRPFQEQHRVIPASDWPEIRSLQKKLAVKQRHQHVTAYLLPGASMALGVRPGLGNPAPCGLWEAMPQGGPTKQTCGALKSSCGMGPANMPCENGLSARVFQINYMAIKWPGNVYFKKTSLFCTMLKQITTL